MGMKLAMLKWPSLRLIGLVLVVTTVAVLLATPWDTQAQDAQDPVLLKNTGQTNVEGTASQAGESLAQAFETGSWVSGYRVSGISIQLRFASNDARASATLNQADADSNNAGHYVPGTEICTLTPQGVPDTNELYEFTAPDSCGILDPGTAYFFAFKVTTGFIAPERIGTGDADSGGSPGWSFIHRLRQHGGGEEDTWELNADQSLELEIRGTINPDVDFCDRTSEVQAAALTALSLPATTDCATITDAQLRSITSLTISGAGLSSLQVGDFGEMTGLTTLTISGHPSLTSLPRGIFDPLTALTTLDLSDNGLTRLRGSAFDKTTRLVTLDLSSNSIATVGAAAFSKTTTLATLDLSSNSLASLPAGIFTGRTSLKTLDLSSNSFTSVPVGVLAPLTGLTTLDLSSNEFSSVPDNAFDALTGLQDLDLSENASLTTLPDDLLDSRTGLRSLDLGTGELTSIHEGFFDPLVQLRQLSLGPNKISTLPGDIFDTLTRLEGLHLANAGLSELPDDAFDDLANLTLLDLGENTLSTLPDDVFDDLAKLTDLRLNGNQITTLTGDGFEGLDALTKLRLDGNQLSALPNGIFEGLDGLTELNLASNTVSPLPVEVGLEVPEIGKFRAMVSTGAPFALTLPITRSAAADTTDSVTVAAGTLHSGSHSVTRTSGESGAATVDLGTLPSLPSGHQGYTLAKASGLPLEMLPQQGQGGVGVAPTSLAIDEAATLEDAYEVVLQAEPPSDVTIAIDGGDELTVSPDSLTFTVDNWDTSQAVSVTALRDGDIEHETFTITHTVSGQGNYAAVTASGVTVVVTDVGLVELGQVGSFDLDPSNESPTDIWSDGTTLWVADEDHVLFAYKLVDDPNTDVNEFGTRDSSKDVDLIVELTVAGTPETLLLGPTGFHGAVEGGTGTVYLADDVRFPAWIFAYDFPSFTFNVNRTFELQPSVGSHHIKPGGMWGAGENLWVGDGSTRHVVRYTLGDDPNLMNDPYGKVGESHSVVGGASVIHGIWSDGETLWVPMDGSPGKLVAYSFSDFSRDARRDISLPPGNNRPRGIWSDGETMYVVDDTTGARKIFFLQYRNNAVGLGQSGFPKVGYGLRAEPGGIIDSSGLPSPLRPEYQWQQSADGSNWTDIAGATRPMYIVTQADADASRLLRVQITFTDLAGYEEVLHSPFVEATDQFAEITVPETLSLAEGTPHTYNVSLLAPPTGDVTINVTAGGDLGVNPGSLTFTMDNWDTPQGVELTPGADDDAVDDTQAIRLAVAAGSAPEYRNLVTFTHATVADDDTTGATLTFPSQSSTRTLAEEDNEQYSVVLDAQPTANVIIDIKTTGDISADPNSLTFTPGNWNAPQNVTITDAGDDDAVDDTNTLSHAVQRGSATEYTGVTIADVTVQVTDDDSAGVEVSLDSLALNEGEGSAYSVWLTAQPTDTVSITVSAGGDLVVNPTTLTFRPNDWEGQNVNVYAGHDANAADDTPAITHSVVAGGASEFSSATVSGVGVTVTDDDEPSITLEFVSGNYVFGEGDATAAAAVKLTTDVAVAPREDVEVTIRSRPSEPRTAVAGTDYTAIDTTLTFAASGFTVDADGNYTQEQTISLDIKTDTIVEAGESFRLSAVGLPSHVSLPASAMEGAGEAVVGINNLTDGTVSFSPNEVNEGDSIVIELSEDSDIDVAYSIQVDTAFGTATAADLAAASRLTNVPRTAEGAGVILVNTTEDNIVEGDETFTVRFSLPSGQRPDRVTFPASLTVTIKDDDAPAWDLHSSLVGITESGGTTTVTLSTGGVVYPTDQTIALTIDGEATAGTDYTIASGGSELTTPYTLTLPAMTSEVTATITATSDTDAETNENIVISGSHNSVVITPVTLTIIDSGSPRVVVTKTTLNITEGDATGESFDVTLNKAPTGNVVVDITTGIGLTASATSLTFTTTDWNMAQTVTVTAGEDTDKVDESIPVNLLVRDADSADEYDDQSRGVGVRVADNDEPDITLSFDPGIQRVPEGSAAFTSVKAETSGANRPRSSITFKVVSAATSGAPATAGEDFSAVSETITLDPADFALTGGKYVATRSIPLDIKEDDALESTEAFELLFEEDLDHVSVSSAESRRQHIVDIGDTSVATPTFGPFEVEEGETLDFKMDLDGTFGRAVSLNVNTVGDTAMENVDYTRNVAAVAIKTSDTLPLTVVSVPALEDNIVEGDEMFFVEVRRTEIDRLILPGRMAIRIIDNDVPAWAVMAGSTQVDEGNGEVTVTVSTGGVVFPENQTLELTASGTATAGVDYTVHRGSTQLSGSSYSITLPAGQSSVTATLRMTLDDYTEPAETIIVTAHHNQQAVGTAETVTITDRGTAGITVSGFPDTMIEFEPYHYQLVLDAPPIQDVTVSNTNNRTVAFPDSGNLTFTPDNWNVAQTVTIVSLADIDAEDEEVIATHSVTQGSPRYRGVAPVIYEGVVHDITNPAITISLSSGTYNAREGGARLNVPVTATTGSADDPESDVTVTILVNRNVDRFAGADDHTEFPSELTFTPEDYVLRDGKFVATKNIQLDFTSDDITEHTETIAFQLDMLRYHLEHNRIRLGSTTNANIHVVDGTGHATLDAVGDFRVAEGETYAPTYNLDKQTGFPFTIVSNSEPLTAGPPTDFRQLGNPLTVFQLGDTTATGVAIDIRQDRVVEGEEQFLLETAFNGPEVNVRFSADTPQSGGRPKLVQVITIIDDDFPDWQVSLDAAQIDEPDGAATLTVATGPDPVDPADLEPVTFPDDQTFTIVLGGTALIAEASGNDYTITVNGSTVTPTMDDTLSALTFDLTLTAGQTMAQATISGIYDPDAEPNETVTLAARYEDAQIGSTTLTLLDGGVPGVTVSTPAIQIIEGDTAGETYTVVLDSYTPGTVRINVGGFSTTDLTVSPTALTFNSGNWDEPQEVTVAARHDNNFRDAMYSLTHELASSSHADYVSLAPAIDGVDVSVEDDDVPVWDVTLSQASIWEREGVATLEVSVGPSPITFAEDQTIELVLAGTATVVTDYSITDSGGTELTTPYSLTLPAGQASVTATITAIDDLLTEPDETVQITARRAGADIGSATATLEDWGSPGVIISRTDLTIGEGGQGEYTVELANQPRASVTLSIAGAGDVSVSPASINFSINDWNVSRPVTVRAAEDDLNALDDQETVTHAIATGSSAEYIDANLNIDSVAITVTDNEVPGATFPSSTLTVNEGSSRTYTVRLNIAPSVDVTVSITAGGDVTVDPVSLDFTPVNWEGPQTVRVTAGEDADGANDEVTLAHSATSTGSDYNGKDMGSVVVTVDDNDEVGVGLAASGQPLRTTSRLTVSEGGAGDYMLALDTQPLSNVTINVTAEDDLSFNGLKQTSLTFTSNNWGTLQTVTVTAGEDNDPDDDLSRITHAVALGSSSEYIGLDIDDVNVSVTDNDIPGATFSVSTVTVAEGGSGQYMMKLNTLPQSSVSITIRGRDDVTVDPENLTFTTLNWNVDQTVTVRAGQDADAADDTVTITHSAASSDRDYNRVRIEGVEVTVTDDETAAVVISQPSLTISEGGTGEYTIVLDTQPLRSVTVRVTTADDVRVSPTSVGFSTGNWDTPKKVTVSARQDDDSNDDTVTLTHAATSSGSDYHEIAIDSVLVTVTDDDIPGVSLSKSSVTVNEGSTGSYTVRLNTEPGDSVTVNITAGDDVGVRTDGAEFTPTASLTFTTSNWNRDQTVRVSAGEDPDAANDEVTISHSATSTDSDYSGATIGGVIVTVDDNDTAGVTLSRSRLTVPEGGLGEYTVVLDTQPLSSVTVNITAGGDVSVSPASLTFFTSDWNSPQTVEVSAVEDDDPDNDMQTLTHSAASSDAGYDQISIDGLDVTVEDNDIPGATLSVSSLTVNENGTAVYTLRLNTQPTDDVTLSVRGRDDLTVSSDGVTFAATVSLTFTTVDWESTQTVTVSAGDDADAANDTVNITHSAASSDSDYNRVRIGGVEVTVTDDDTAGVSISTPSLTIGEGGMGEYTVVLDTQPLRSVTVRTTTADDVRVSPTSVGFSTRNWDTPRKVTVSARQDNDVDDDQVTITHAVSTTDNEYREIEVAQVSVNVTDDDSIITISADRGEVSEGSPAAFTLNRVGKTDTAITVTVNISERGRHLAPSENKGNRMVEMGVGVETFALTLATEEDAEDEANGVVTARVVTGTGYLVGEVDTTTVNVVDNDPPVVTGNTELTIRENTNRSLGSFRATDPGRVGITWSVTGSDSASFVVTSSGALYFSAPPNFEAKETYAVTVQASDGSLAGTLDVTVTVEDVEELGIVAITPPRSWIGQSVSADLSDPDGGVSGESWQWSRSRSRSSGWTDIEGAGSSAYSPGADDVDNYLRASVTYTDRRGPDKTAHGVMFKTIEETAPTTNTAPEFEPKTVSFRVSEGVSPGRNVGRVSATDPDDDVLTYVISSFTADGVVFDIDASTGLIRTKAILDLAIDDVYTIRVSVHDGFDASYSPSESIDANLEVIIEVTAPRRSTGGGGGGSSSLPSNQAPAFADGETTIRSVVENTGPGTHIGAPLGATAADGGTLTYALGGADADSFDIDEASGQLITKTELDYETQTVYTVEVTVTDPSGASATITVTIMVANVGLDNAYDLDDNDGIDKSEAIAAVIDYFEGIITRDEVVEVILLYFSASSGPAPVNSAPVFPDMDPETDGVQNARTRREVAENTGAGQPVGAPVAATDSDADILTYTLNGADAASFGIDGATGQIRVGPTTVLDYEDPDRPEHEYEVIVTATDPSGDNAAIMVTIAVTNVGLDNAYDLNDNGVIEKSEAVAAVIDYFEGIITRDEVVEVILLYFSG